MLFLVSFIRGTCTAQFLKLKFQCF